MLKIEIPIEPRTKKNSSQIRYRYSKGGRKHPYPAPSKAFLEYQDAAACYLLKYRGLLLNERVNIEAKFYMKTLRVVDLVGLLQALDDMLVKYKILEDDNSRIIASHDGSEVLLDRTRPRTEITITRKTD